MTNEPVAKKALGQYWLKDENSLEAICRAANVESGDRVLEIGPGTGELTKVLLGHGGEITALEFDQSLIDSLRKKFSDQKVDVIQGDIRTFDLAELPKDYKIVANIPYYLTANLLRLITDADNKPSVAVILVQKEVAERVAEKPGKMSFISAAVQLNYQASLGDVVGAELFTPAPKVDSQILILKRLPEALFGDVDYLELIRFIKLGFTQPRKTLANNLNSDLKLNRQAIEAALSKLGLKPTVRAQELTLNQWHNLYASL